MAAIARYWRRDDSHEQIADEICFDGTPAHEQRLWAERNGFVVREMCGTWDSVRALLDRGVPLAVSVADPPDAHMLAVVGYDEARGTIQLRDPSFAWRTEAHADGFLAKYAWCGPRAMICVPESEAARLDGLELPESDAYDRVHAVEVALASGRVGEARAEVARVESAFPGHGLSLHARMSVGLTADDDDDVLASANERLAAEPADLWAEARAVEALRRLERSDDALARMRAAVVKPGGAALFAAPLSEAYAASLDGRGEAERWLKVALRAQGDRSHTLAVRARDAWSRRDRERALRLYRLAALGEPTHEGHARAYALALQASGQALVASRVLGERCARWGRRGAEPWRTHAWALEMTGELREGLRVLEEGARLHPDDGALHLAVARARARLGIHDGARDALQRARALVAPPRWDRGDAEIRELAGDVGGALEAWRRVAASAPASLDAHTEIARLVAAFEGLAAARAHVSEVVACFPGRPSFLRLAAQWTSAPPARRIAALDAVLAASRGDPWTLRERAIDLVHADSFDEAEQALVASRELAPESTAADIVAAAIELAARRVEPALQHLRAAFLWAPDDVSVASNLLSLPLDPGRRLELLDEVRAGALARGITGAAFERWFETATLVLDAASVRAHVEEAHRVRPDCPRVAHVAVVERMQAGDLDAAHAIACLAAERFPADEDLLRVLAEVRDARGERQAALAVRADAVAQFPASVGALEALASADPRRARELLDRAAAIAPLGSSAIELAKLEGPAGVARAERILARTSSPELATRAARLLLELGEAERVHAWMVARREPASWAEARLLAAVATTLDEHGVALAAATAACELEPRNAEAHDERAALLAQRGSWIEAERACRPPAFGDAPPVSLRGRAAWVLAQRGDLAAAMDRMRAVVDANPEYAWGWRQLLIWSSRTGNREEGLRAARALAWLAPDAASQGAAELGAGHVDLAVTHLGAAAMRSGDLSAAIPLVHHLMDVGRLDEAARLLARAGQLEDPVVRFAAVRLAALRDDLETAAEQFAAICVTGQTTNLVGAAREILIRAGHGDAAQAVLEDALDRAETSEAAGDLAMRTRLRRTRRRALAMLSGRNPAHGAVVGAWKAWLAACIEARARWSLLRVAILRRETLRATTRLWANAGWALMEAGWRWPARLWLHDWRDRDDARPWMLWNLCAALHALGAHRAAREVSAAAARLEPDHTSPYHEVWLAYEAAVDGRFDEARAAATTGASKAPADFVAVPHALTRAIVYVASAPAPDRAAALTDARLELAAVVSDPLRMSLRSPLRSVIVRAERRLARETGTARAYLWAFRVPAIVTGSVLCLALIVTTVAESPDAARGVTSVVFVALLGWRAAQRRR